MVRVPGATGIAAGDEPAALRIGDPVRNLAFVRSDGATLTLAAFAGRPLLLIFLRHLA